MLSGRSTTTAPGSSSPSSWKCSWFSQLSPSRRGQAATSIRQALNAVLPEKSLPRRTRGQPLSVQIEIGGPLALDGLEEFLVGGVKFLELLPQSTGLPFNAALLYEAAQSADLQGANAATT